MPFSFSLKASSSLTISTGGSLNPATNSPPNRRATGPSIASGSGNLLISTSQNTPGTSSSSSIYRQRGREQQNGNQTAGDAIVGDGEENGEGGGGKGLKTRVWANQVLWSTGQGAVVQRLFKEDGQTRSASQKVYDTNGRRVAVLSLGEERGGGAGSSGGRDRGLGDEMIEESAGKRERRERREVRRRERERIQREEEEEEEEEEDEEEDGIEGELEEDSDEEEENRVKGKGKGKGKERKQQDDEWEVEDITEE